VKRPVVLALNPSLDAEWRVDGVRWEEKNNVLAEQRWAGGKGVNVARWLNWLGARPLIVLPLGGASGEELAAGLHLHKISARIVPIREATRVNVIVTTRKQGQLRFNPAGPGLSRAEWQAVLTALRGALRNASCLVLSGSLPQGLPVGTYGSLIRLARPSGVPVLLDCDGPALAAAARARPFLVKPNEHELIEWSRTAGGRTRADRTWPGLRLPGVREEILSAAWRLSCITRGWVLVSCGPRPGLLVSASQELVITAKPPRVTPQTTVGAGDALLAAVTHQVLQAAPPEAWLRAGLATGSAATQLRAGQLPEP
jgi:1-phosphofructokinase family hexose kinase